MGNLLRAEGLLGTEFSASRLVELANNADEAAGVKIPGIPAEATDEQKAQRVGLIMAPLFKNGPVAEVDLYRITRTEREEERPEHRDSIIRKFYVFSQSGQ